MRLTQRFRRQVAPYDVTTSLKFVPGTNYCPDLQTESNAGGVRVFTPDRTLAPTVIAADVIATSKDNSGSIESAADSQVVNLRWYVQKGDEAAGTPIENHPDWTAAEYQIGTGADKGRLIVKKNVPSEDTWKVWLEFDIHDPRRGYSVSIPCKSDNYVLLHTLVNAEDQISMNIDRPSSEIYEIALDKRLIYEYRKGNGLDVSDMEDGSGNFNADDGNTYLRMMNVRLKKGDDTLTAGTDYDIRIFKMSGMNRTEMTVATDDNIESVVGDQVTFNLLFAEEATYQIACFINGNEVGHKTYGWAWSDTYPTTDEGLVGGATYVDSNTQSYKPKLNLGGSVLQHPTIAFVIEWGYLRSGGATAYVGAGDGHTYDITDNNMFTALGNGEAEAVCDITKRSAAYYIMDESNVRMEDEDGPMYEN